MTAHAIGPDGTLYCEVKWAEEPEDHVACQNQAHHVVVFKDERDPDYSLGPDAFFTCTHHACLAAKLGWDVRIYSLDRAELGRVGR